ncbi:MAG TPA: metallophosphoesterase [Clostridia bacterium]|nr:metallophosphoesterase [Clostridia bacterium]
MKRIFSVFLSLVLVFSISVTALAQNSISLRFGEEGTFTILQITDPQDDHYPAPDMLRLINLAIEESKPDLVVFTGDIVEDRRSADPGVDAEDWREGVCAYDDAGNLLHEETVANVRTACDAIFEEVEHKGIPFAVTLGNNDYQAGLDGNDWLEILDDYAMNLTFDDSDDPDDRVDYTLDILSSENGKRVFVLWMMDTEESAVTRHQLKWFRSKSKSHKNQNGGKPIPSMVFQHIAVEDVGNLFERCHAWDDGATPSGISFYRLNRDIARGQYTAIRKPGKYTWQFKSWRDDGGVLAAFFGHYHDQGYSGTWKGIELNLTYACQFAKSGPYGFRVITLHEENLADYDNDQYVYEGSVFDDNEQIIKVIDEPYPVYDNFTDAFIAGFQNALYNLKRMFSRIFS